MWFGYTAVRKFRGALLQQWLFNIDVKSKEQKKKAVKRKKGVTPGETCGTVENVYGPADYVSGTSASLLWHFIRLSS